MGSKRHRNLTKCKCIWPTVLSDSVEFTVAPFGVAELDVTASAGRVLPGSLRGEQVLDLTVEGLDGGIDLVVLGSQRGLISSVLIVSRDIISTTRGAGRSVQTGRSSRTLMWIKETIDMWIPAVVVNCLMYETLEVLTEGPTYPGSPRTPVEPMYPWPPALPSLPMGPLGPPGP